jgi:molybdopterin-containing oxidoreductase family iron-sulfur binding subunit
MSLELKRASAKEQAKVRWAMVIDQAKCIGCHACAVACVSENRLGPGVVYRPVIEQETGTYPNVGRRFLPRPCMQCENPPCVSVCPVTATSKNAQGVTVVDYQRCIGCRYCLAACPYGARCSDFGGFYTSRTAESPGQVQGRNASRAYEKVNAPEYGKPWDERGKGSPVGNARKCHFCLHRLAVGQLPACVTSCVGRATYFGDRSDPASLVSQLIGSPRAYTLKPELGARPAVFYLA